jgi:hypothetical protein
VQEWKVRGTLIPPKFSFSLGCRPGFIFDSSRKEDLFPLQTRREQSPLKRIWFQLKLLLLLLRCINQLLAIDLCAG